MINEKGENVEKDSEFYRGESGVYSSSSAKMLEAGGAGWRLISGNSLSLELASFRHAGQLAAAGTMSITLPPLLRDRAGLLRGAPTLPLPKKLCQAEFFHPVLDRS